ncbi:hypothetical protein [Chroococcidiopsis sp.]|uniref:hypothetical protein n=1 Tax=Chroococcidiopsis sp. TaxID=3088168 RepID=UPI003F3B7CE0
MGKINSKGEGSNLSKAQGNRKASRSDEHSFVRSAGLESRRDITDAIVSKGGDQNTIARVTVRCDRAVTGGRPEPKKREDWDLERQREMAAIEHYGAQRIRDLPDNAGDSRILKAADEGASIARDAIEDKKENGNYFVHIFGSFFKRLASDQDRLEFPESGGSSSQSNDEGKVWDGVYYSKQDMDDWYRMP